MLLSFIKKIANHSFVAPFYHVVSDEPLPHVEQLYNIKTIQQFKDDLDFLLKHFKPIDLQSLHQYILQHAQLPKNTFFLSFDDGFKECATIVAPILQEQGIPATFFINSAFVNNRNMMYRCKVSLLVDRLNVDIAQDMGAFTLAKRIYHCRYDESELINYFAKELNVGFKDYLCKQKPYLSSNQIKKLYEQGFNIGSHSVDHPWFRDLSYKKQKRQIIESLRSLRQIVPAVNSFSFPFSDDGIATSLLEFIYNQNIALTFACAGVKQDETIQHIQRLAMEQDIHAKKQTSTKAPQLLPKAFLTYLVKKFLQRHKVVRPLLN